MPNTKLEWALDTAARGFPVFQLNPNAKTPIHKRSFYKATVDPVEIEEMWDALPNANIGVYPGADFIIVDIDQKSGKDGIKNIFERLQETPAEYLYETFSVKTPSGGYHLYYKSDIQQGYASSVGRENKDNEICGVDIRASGGYVVGPGSTIDDKTYEIVNDTSPTVFNRRWVPIAKPAYAKPEDRVVEPLFDIDMPSAVQQAIDYLSRADVAVSGSGGNSHTFTVLANCRDMGVSKDKAIEIAEQFWNPRCEPPWSPFELNTIANNVWNYAHNQPGERGAALMDMLLDDKFMEDHPEEAKLFEATGDQESDKADMALVQELQGAALWGADAILNSSFKREMIIPKWLPAHGFTGLLAPRNTGKTVFMIDLAHRLACDMNWYGEKVREGMTSFYICGEDIEGATQYAKAWMTYHHDKRPGENRICIMPITVDLMNRESTKAFTYLMCEEIKKRKIKKGKFIIFIDTWQRATSRGGMNKDEDMQTAVHNCESLGRSVGGPVVVAFHPSKHGDTSDISGSAVVGNSSTAIWTFKHDSTLDAKVLRTNRVKGGKEGITKNFEFKIIDLNEKDEYGLDIDSVCMIEKTLDAELIKEQDPELLTWAEAVVKIFKNEGMVDINRGMAQQLLRLDDVDLHQRLMGVTKWYKGPGAGDNHSRTVKKHLGDILEKFEAEDYGVEVIYDDIHWRVRYEDGKFSVRNDGKVLPETPPPKEDELD